MSFITPTFEEAKAIAEAGSDMIALDATGRPRPKGTDLGALIRRIHEDLGLPRDGGLLNGGRGARGGNPRRGRGQLDTVGLHAI